MKLQILQVGPLAVCCYLAWDEHSGSAVLVDPGGNAGQIREMLEQSELRLRHIFLTHLHYDHIGAVDALRGPEVSVWVCPAELAGDLSLSQGKMDLKLPLRHYDEGDTVTVDGMRFEVLRTPGHTPGSVCLRCGDVLFTGDTLFAGSCGRTDFPGGDHGAMMASLRRLAEMDGALLVLSGHSAPSTIGREREHNPFVREALQ